MVLYHTVYCIVLHCTHCTTLYYTVLIRTGSGTYHIENVHCPIVGSRVDEALPSAATHRRRKSQNRNGDLE